jgi:hypothetical protein
MDGFGFTVMVAVVVEEHPLGRLAVMVNTVETGEVVLLVNVPAILEPVPLAAIPVTVLELVLVQLNVVPVGLSASDSAMLAILVPVQIVWKLLVATTEVGAQTI